MTKITDFLTPTSRQAPVALLLLGVLYASFTMGGIAGVNALENESVDRSEIHADLDGVNEKVVSDIEVKYGWFAAKAAGILGTPFFESAIGFAKWGVDFGYSHPGAARLNAYIGEYLAPFSMLGAIAWQNVRIIKRLGRLR